MKKSKFESRFIKIILIIILSTWGAFHYSYKDVVIVHDSWQHIFPIVFNIGTSVNCLDIPLWLASVDNGSPVIIYLISFSLTQILRIPLLLFWGCTQPDTLTAIWQYKLQIYLTYALFSGGVYFLGRLLFKSKLSAIYLFSTTLFAGLCIDSSHSNQVASILFWFPWIISAGYLYHHSSVNSDRVKYFTFVIILICAQLLDQYPHFTVLSCLTGGIIYFCSNPVKPTLSRNMLVSMWHLSVIRDGITSYAPSLRSNLIVDPSSFGETGFVQPTALLGTLFPVTFLAGFDVFGNGMARLLHVFGAQSNIRWFIFKLDMLLFSVGWIPLILSAVFIFTRDISTLIVRRAWIIFGLFMFAVSLQQTHFYLLLFHLPFFNVFRSYFLFVVFAVFSLVILSGYGMDKLLSVSPSNRSELILIASKRLAKLLIGSFLFLGFLALLAPDRNILINTIPEYILSDFLMLAFAATLTYLATRLHSHYLVVVVLIVGTALPQLYFSRTAYKMTGITDLELLESFSKPPKNSFLETSYSGSPMLNKHRCEKFADCYLSNQSATSLNLNHEGTFLRNKNEPVFATGLSNPMLEALSRVNRPTSWLSENSDFVSNRADATAKLNEMTSDPDKGLREVTFVYAPLILSNRKSEPVLGEVLSESRNGKKTTFTIVTNTSMILNISNNFSNNWKVTVNGALTSPIFANLGNLAVVVGSGASTVELTYFSIDELGLILSRVAIVFVSIFIAILIARKALKVS
jgi:hypothetical protein